ISVSFRPILGATEELAWERPHRILDAIENPAGPGPRHRGWRGANGQPKNAGSQRLLAAAARCDLHDRARWTATARASGAGGNSTALVGTPDTVAQALLDYVDLGVSTLLIRGYDPLEDATDYGRELIPLVRAEVARRDATQAGAEAELAGRS
ncbi:MAG: LLM class flavin-dependent oxidoreductase, partial [Streptosporangiaceae bacterium]